jgi:ABC-type multidrug transport system fused ATPase/permease subunit/thiamine kinase-like enzyme
MSNLARAKTIAQRPAEQKAAKPQSEIGRAARLVTRFTAGQRHNFVLAALMLVLEALSAVLIPLLIAYLIDGYLTPRIKQLTGAAVVPPLSPLTRFGLPTLFDPDIDTVAVVTIGIVLLTLVNSLSDSLAEIFLAKGGRMLGLNLRIALYAHLQRLSLAFYGKQRTGDLLTRVTGDVTALEDFVTASLSDIVGSVLLIVFILGTIILNAWQVALMALVIIPVMALVSNYFSQRIKSASKKQRAREGELAASAQEMLTSIRVIQAYGRSGNQEQKFAAQSRKTMESALEAAGLQARFSGVVSVLESVAVAVVIWLGVWLLFQSPLAFGIGLLTAFIKYIQDMFKPTKKIIKEWNTFGKIYASVERIGEIFDRQPAVQDAPDAIEAPPLKGQITYEQISFAYQAEPDDRGEAELRLALRNVSFGIAPGEVVALVGGSGAGKSTIVQLLPRLYDPHAGRITIDGRDIREFTLDSLRARMSMVLQEAILFTGTVAENIAYGAENATREDVIAAAMQANAHEFIEKLPDGYDTVLGERASNLSGGQRQRIAIARAFIRNTPILILDEPTTGLDAESTDLVLLALRSLMKGKATVIISHDLNLIRHADKILVVKQGEIVQQGTHKQLLRAGGLYADLYHKQFGQAVEEQGGQLKPAAATPAAEDDDEPEPVTPKVFQTLIGKALPQPVTPKAFQTMMLQALPVPESAQPASGGTPVAPPAAKPAPAAASAAVAPAANPAPAPSPAPKPAPTPQAAPVAAPAKPAAKPAPRPQPAIFETTVMRVIPDHTQATVKEIIAAPGQAERPAPADALDPLASPVLRGELPGIVAAFDGAAMRDYLQSALFGKSNTQYTIERCAPGKAIYQDGICALRYDLQLKDQSGGPPLKALVGARLFADQLACAVYLRDKLAPLVNLTRGRPEIAPFATPAAMIEPLNMVVYAFPIDGELPTLVGATDRRRMADILSETLPEALSGDLAIQDVRVVPANYARRHRCVLRYEITGTVAGKPLGPRAVYGKVADDTQGAQIALVIAALRERVLAGPGADQFNLPRSLGYRPDLQMSLLEAIPGTPQISQLLKARLGGDDAPGGGLALEQALDACARIASSLHGSGIKLGRRRTLDDDLSALQQEIDVVQRITPELGARFQSWLERIESYAEESDPLRLCFSHGDYTYAQLIFDGQQSGLVDFDTVCQAEPALDIGQFLAYLRVAAHKARKAAAPGAAPIGEQLGEHFLAAYIAAAGDGVEDGERLRVRASVYEVVSLMRMALHSWHQLKGARLANAIDVLQEAMERLPQLDY